MPISIKNHQTELLARKLAEMTGQTLTDAIRGAVSEKYDRLRQEQTGRTMADDLNEIGLRCASRPRISNLTDDEILGYDEFGVPTK